MLVFLVFAASYQLSEVGDLPDDVLNGFYKICKYKKGSDKLGGRGVQM